MQDIRKKLQRSSQVRRDSHDTHDIDLDKELATKMLSIPNMLCSYIDKQMIDQIWTSCSVVLKVSKRKGVILDLKSVTPGFTIQLVEGNIVNETVDCIVSSATEGLEVETASWYLCCSIVEALPR